MEAIKISQNLSTFQGHTYHAKKVEDFKWNLYLSGSFHENGLIPVSHCRPSFIRNLWEHLVFFKAVMTSVFH